MKKMIWLLTAVFAVTTASAQENNGQRERQHFDRTEMMVKEYNLNADQAEKVKALNEQYADLFIMRGRGFGRPGGPRGMAPQTEQKPEGQTGATAQQRQPRRDRQMPNREEMEKRMKERREKMEAYNAELKKIMTPEQFDAYEKRMQEMRNRRPQMPRQ